MKTRILCILYLLAVVIPLSSSRSWAAPAYPLRISSDGRHIVDQNGTEQFFQADSPWHIIARLTREDAIVYLDDRHQKNFNALLVSLIVSEGYRTGNTSNAYGETPFVPVDDFSAPNEAYFAHADWFLEQARIRGFTVFLAPAYIGFDCNNSGWCEIMRANGVTKMREYGNWVANRYKDQPNIVWVDGGDADAAQWNALDLVDAVAFGIRDLDSVHLHTAHCRRYSSAVDCYDRPWLDFNTTYADCSRSPLELQTDYQRPTIRPFVLIEARYEFERDWTDQCVRAQAYWSLLGGAIGQFFGVGPIWDFESNWKDVLDTQGSRSMVHLWDLLRSRRFDLLVPDYGHAVLTSGFGDVNTADYAAAARTIDGNTVLVYVPQQRSLTIDMSMVGGSSAQGWWFNPIDGSSQSLGSFPTSGSRDFSPPFNQDWVLVLDDEAAQLGPPGERDIFVAVEKSSWGALKGSYERQ